MIRWQDLGACRPYWPRLDWIDPATEADADECRAICWTCPMFFRCLADAIEKGEVGIWGGTDELERAELAQELGIERPRLCDESRACYAKHGCENQVCKDKHAAYMRQHRAQQHQPAETEQLDLFAA